MKKIYLLLFLVLVLKFGWAQNSNLEYKYAIKVYNLTSYEEYIKSTSYLNQTRTSFQLLHPTVAFQWNNDKRNTNEVELTNFELGKIETISENKDTTIAGINNLEGVVKSTMISARYEYILNFNKSKDRKFVPSVGFGINLYYKQKNYEPKITSNFNYSELYFGSKLFLTPRLSYFIGSKFFIEINIPICISDFYYSVDKNENPIYQSGEGTNSSFNIDIFPKIFTGRIGIGIKI